MSDDPIKTRTDKYADQRATLRAGEQGIALRRVWEMAREALATRANLGVKILSYDSDLVPGVENTRIVAHPTHVEITLGASAGRPAPRTSTTSVRRRCAT
jgi:hypothetical protein